MKIFKKLIIAVVVLLILLVGALFATPYLFKDKIVETVKAEANKNLNATFDFEDVDLSLLRTFPDLYFEMKNVTVTGKDTFRDIPLVQIGRFGLRLDLMKLFKGSKTINEIDIIDGNFIVKVLENGQANYEIVKSSGEEQEESGEESPLEMHLDRIVVKNMRLLYDDESLGIKKYLAGTDYTGKVNIVENTYSVDGNLKADTLDVWFDGVHYLNNAKAQFEHKLLISNNLSKYEMPVLKGRINRLGLDGNLMFDLKDNGDVDMKINLAGAQSDLTSYLSLIPPAYMPDLSGMSTSGKAALKVKVEGVFNEKNYPAYDILFKVDKGRIKMKDLPEAVENLNVDTKVTFPGGGDLDLTKISLENIAFNIAGSTTKGYLYVSRPMSDPHVKTAMKSNMDLASFKKALPMKGVKTLKGKLDADFALEASVSDMEKQRTERIKAKGYFNLKDFVYGSDSMPVTVEMPQLETHIDPSAWQIDKWNLQVGKSDFDIQGKVENYLAWFTGKDSLLVANFGTQSGLIDFNELSALSGGEEGEETSTDSLQVIRIPGGLDVQLRSKAKRVIYDDLTLRDVDALLKIKDRKAELSGVLMKAFGGEMKLTGIYDTSKPDPYSGLSFTVNKAQIDSTATSLALLANYAPLLKQIKGWMDMNLKAGMQLDSSMKPVFSTVDAQGQVATGTIRPENVNFFHQAASVLKLKALENPEIKSAKAQFKIEKGTLTVKPFKFTVNNMESSLGGKVTLDKKVDFDWHITIPVKMLGAKAEQWLGQFKAQLGKWGLDAGSMENIDVVLKITGDINKPSIKPVFKGGTGKSGLQETVTQVVQQQVDKAVDSVKAVASQKAEELIRQAEAQGDALIAEAEKQAAKIKAEADKQAEELIKKARNPLEKLAAKKAADALKKKAYQKADQLVEKARKEKEKLVEKARREAEKLK